MAIKRFNFIYGFHDAEATFKVDTDVFTADLANATLEFFSWEYDEDNDPIEEVMKKYAMEAIKIASFSNLNTSGVISEFEDLEGFGRIDGSLGVKLVYVDGLQFDEDELQIKVKTEN